MEASTRKWLYLIILSLVWGSSFILIKKALLGLSPLQLGALRTLMAAAFLLLAGYSTLKKIPKRLWKWIVISGFLGTFFPAFLFAFAETEINSAVASMLNSTTPIMALIFGGLVFGIPFTRNQFLGVIIGLVGTSLLIYLGAELNPGKNYWYAGLVLIASICYAFNVNIIKRHLQEVPALAIAAGNFIVLIIPAFGVLVGTGFFSETTFQHDQLVPSLGYIALLALVGTGVAKVLFNRLVQISSPVFATSVTYMIPMVAVLWGVLDGEQFGVGQLIAAGVILSGVYLANK
ncbi:DMT family transporter [Altibacter sp. HG106]|uniref:DMT family transporter n=1 Tax=Altibacter sp. HG106 TaxID=3023937 RepID=UPI00234FF91E|nr:EamA family transporter [Altibacter sp. HG106]MDC7995211.1 EamA family transporter [Altibacter sp. HG106]